MKLKEKLQKLVRLKNKSTLEKVLIVLEEEAKKGNSIVILNEWQFDEEILSFLRNEGLTVRPFDIHNSANYMEISW